MPSVSFGGRYLTAWHDNREAPDAGTYEGEIYAAGLACP
jgi:hypothetical protein